MSRPSALPLPRPNSMGAWILAARPKTLPVGIAPIIVGIAVAYTSSAEPIQYPIAAVCLVTALLLQILSNLANDFYDFKKGADNDDRLGPPRAMQQGLITHFRMRVALVVVSFLAMATGSVLVWHGGWPYVVLGIMAVLCAIVYTGGPFPLGYNGLGDIFVFVFFGLVAVVGTTQLCGKSVSAPFGIPVIAWPAACAMGLLAMNLLVVNNVRDELQDRQHGKKTVVARWGKRFGIAQYAFGLFFAYVCVGLIASLTQNHWVFLTGAIAPIGIHNFRRLTVLEGKMLNDVLAKTAMFTFLFGGVLALALVVPRV
ncbi:MAG: 1,4-dihydroxy-2-naphthoate octaprenyltransferase [Deltaproteobacteria bacterium]|nr:1,4-dihydroxy-2-naphthoate octaprenyltransferase [Deltaproteobacteria bacterium]